MMNYLAELPFVDIFDAKANKAFFWRVDNPLDLPPELDTTFS
ncbi:TPA: hypothetical protein ACMEXA_005268 [Klebsiella variicola subsp. variicola]|nr:MULTISPECIES: hypothetical protein [Klebsiella]MEC5935722.1 hypothetical protein [Klebsiella pneumoniae]MEC5999573.1 hypothetical protein [Klebsiella variicola]